MVLTKSYNKRGQAFNYRVDSASDVG